LRDKLGKRINLDGFEPLDPAPARR